MTSDDPLADSEVSDTILKRMVDRFNGFFYQCRADDKFTMVYLSDGIRRILGYAPGEFIGESKRSFVSIVSPKDGQVLSNGFAEAMKSSRGWNLDYRLIGKTGEEVWVNDVGSTFYTPDGVPQYYEGILTVIEDRKRIEAEREEIMDMTAAASTEIISSTRAIFDLLGKLKTLALNARIESARAGEAGKGFSVVAQEMNALAREAGTMASRIDTTTEELQKGFQRARM